MVGIVIVTHSNHFANGLLHELRMFSKSCPIAVAGGDDNDDYGTSFNKIKSAINEVHSDDGVCIITDIGSSVMTTQMVLEELNNPKIVLLDCPTLEGAIVATMSSEQGKSVQDIINEVPKPVI